MRPEVVTCPVCGKRRRLLTKAGLFRKHDDTTRTALREWGSLFDHQTCAAWGCTPEQAKKSFSIRLSH